MKPIPAIWCRADYEERISEKVNHAQELEHRQNELEAQTTEYLSLSDLTVSVKGKENILAALIGRLIDKIEVFSDRRIKITFTFESEFERYRRNGTALRTTCGIWIA